MRASTSRLPSTWPIRGEDCGHVTSYRPITAHPRHDLGDPLAALALLLLVAARGLVQRLEPFRPVDPLVEGVLGEVLGAGAPGVVGGGVEVVLVPVELPDRHQVVAAGEGLPGELGDLSEVVPLESVRCEVSLGVSAGVDPDVVPGDGLVSSHPDDGLGDPGPVPGQLPHAHLLPETGRLLDDLVQRLQGDTLLSGRNIFSFQVA